MKKKGLLLAVLSTGFLVTSCNKNNYINRVTFKDATYTDASKIYKKMVESQESKFFDKGTSTIRYSMKATGNMRIDDMSFHNINLSASAGFVISWSIKDEYLKLEGEKEVLYYKKIDNVWWRLENYKSSSKEFHYKINYNDQITDFKDWIIDNINEYSTIALPGMFAVGIGITGDVNYSSLFTTVTLQPADLFEEDNHKHFEELKTTYENAKEGYSSSLTYGSNDDNSVSTSLKGKYKSSDIHDDKQMEGYVNIDSFTSFKDNFVSQGEFIASGNVGSKRMNNINLDFNLYLSEEVEKDQCVVDTINLSDYKDPK